MKITILPIEKKQEPLDTITLYNLVKRSQEDLLAGLPSLAEFILEIKMHPTFVKYNIMPAGMHILCEADRTVRMIIPSYPLQEPEKVYQKISEKLIRLKESLHN
jgi:hypothetical protein